MLLEEREVEESFDLHRKLFYFIVSQEKIEQESVQP